MIQSLLRNLTLSKLYGRSLAGFGHLNLILKRNHHHIRVDVPILSLVGHAIEKKPYLVNIHICSVLLNPLDSIKQRRHSAGQFASFAEISLSSLTTCSNSSTIRFVPDDLKTARSSSKYQICSRLPRLNRFQTSGPICR